MADPPIVVRSVVDHLLAAQQGSIAVGLDEVYYSIVDRRRSYDTSSRKSSSTGVESYPHQGSGRTIIMSFLEARAPGIETKI